MATTAIVEARSFMSRTSRAASKGEGRFLRANSTGSHRFSTTKSGAFRRGLAICVGASGRMFTSACDSRAVLHGAPRRRHARILMTGRVPARRRECPDL